MALKEVTKPLGFQQIAVLTASTGLTVPGASTGILPARMAIIHAEAQPVRWRDDGVAPTATVGMRLQPGQELKYDGDLNAIRFIEETASAKINISYYE